MLCPTVRHVSVAVALSIVMPSFAMADQHLVTPDEMAARLRAAAAERTGNERKIQRLLASSLPAAAQGAGIHRLRAGVAALNDDELRDLAGRADALQADPVAGATRKTWIIIGVAVLVVVLLAALIVKDCKEQGAECVN